MKLNLKHRKGVADLSLGLIIALVVLFIGIFMIVKITAIQPSGDLADYSYNTTVNDTSVGTITSANDSFAWYNFTVGVQEELSGKSANNRVQVAISTTNVSEGATLTVLVNEVSAGTMNVSAGTSETNVSRGEIASVTLVSGVSNNISFGTTMDTANHTIENVTLIWGDGSTRNAFGRVYDSTSTNVATIYDVLILVLIIVALGVAIAVLKGFSQTAGAGATAI